MMNSARLSVHITYSRQTMGRIIFLFISIVSYTVHMISWTDGAVSIATLVESVHNGSQNKSGR